MLVLRNTARKIDYSIAELVFKVSSSKTLTTIITGLLIAFAVVLGVLIRTAPFGLNGFEFFEFDSYIEYWQAKYVYENGPLAWYTLTRSNPDTHVFWYPWGRDFIYTSYPFFPLWIGTTYHLVKNFGLTLEQWAALQPVIFASIATILAYFAAKELTGSRIAGITASFLFAVLPSAVERTVIGYVEKEGAASVFVFLFIYFYVKALKNTRTTKTNWIKYTILAGLSMALIGWLWGGYIFVLGTVVAFAVLSPLITGKYFTRELALTNLLLVISAMIFEIPSPTNSMSLGIYPFSIKGLAWPLLSATLLPLIYYYLSQGYRNLGLRKPLLNQARYLGVLILLLIGGIALTSMGLLPIGGRLAWALGLRFVQVTPLVESIAEHQSPLINQYTLMRMLHSWGATIEALFFASPLMLSILAVFYLLYKGEPEKTYLAIGFALAFYSYLNAVYMIGIASYFGVLAASSIIPFILEYVFPYSLESKRDKKKAGVVVKRISPITRFIATLFFILIIVNTGYTAYAEHTLNSRIVYTLKAGVSDLGFYSNSWYKAVETMRNEIPSDGLVISWWDYGYGITVAGGRASAADGSTINETQIGIIGLILTSKSGEQAVQLAKLLNAPVNKTYLMIIEGVIIGETNDTVTIMPLFIGRGLPGLVDWPKSLWMIRIGNGRVPILNSMGINASYVDTEKFFRVYNVFGGVIAPKLDDTENTPLIYKMLVDAMLWWAREEKGKAGQFMWFTGTEEFLDYATIDYFKTQLKLNITKSINVQDLKWITERPLANDAYIKPFKVVVEPFIDPRTGEPLKFGYTIADRNYEGVVYSVIVFYELNIS